MKKCPFEVCFLSRKHKTGLPCTLTCLRNVSDINRTPCFLRFSRPVGQKVSSSPSWMCDQLTNTLRPPPCNYRVHQKKNAHFSCSIRKSTSLLAPILLVRIGDMYGNKTAKYLSQAHFCSWESEVESWESILGIDKPSSIDAHYAF